MNKEKLPYLDLLAVQEYVDDMIKYCEQQYLSLKKKIDADKQKNEQLRYDYQEYQYEEYFDTDFKIHAYDNQTSFTDFKDLNSWQSAFNSKMFAELRYVEVNLNLCWRSGKKSEKMEEHIHKFTVRFEPNASYFSYELSNNDEECRDVYQTIINKLEEFPSVRTIFSKWVK